MHRITAYNRSALWDAVKAWLYDNGPAANGTINPSGAVVHTFNGKASSSWKIYPADTPKADRKPMEPYVTPDDAKSCWKTHGPVAGPFKAYPGDGTVVTYFWYRFADQPALLNADLTDAEREELQTRVVKLHRQWKKDGEYLAPSGIGKLAYIDHALIVIPPKGLEVGYVPIATRQGVEK
jgi:hypothetical protein